MLPLALASLFSPSVTTLLNGVRIEHASWNSGSSDAVLLLMGHSARLCPALSELRGGERELRTTHTHAHAP